MRTSLASILLFAALLTACPKGEPAPGEAEFERANDAIMSESIAGGPRGNTPNAEERAAKVAAILEELDRQLFSGQNRFKAMSMTDHFLVHCQRSPDGVAFLIHVPQFKRYQDDVRDTLLDAAWAAAAAATEDLKWKGPVRLGVGLRGTVSYGAVMIGIAGGEKEFEMGEVVDPAKLYPFFVTPAEPDVKAATQDAPARAPEPPPPPPPPARVHVRTDYVHHLAKSAVDDEIRAHDAELQGCSKYATEGEIHEYVVEIKADGKVKKFDFRPSTREPPPLFTGCLKEAARTWVFPTKLSKPAKADTASIRVGFVSELPE